MDELKQFFYNSLKIQTLLQKNSQPPDAMTFMSDPPIQFLFIPQRNNFYVTYMEKQIFAETVKMLKYAIALGIFSRVNDHLIQSVNIKFQLAIMNF